MLHVYGQSLIIYPVKCNYAIIIISYYIFVNILDHQACIDNTVQVMYNFCFW